MSLKAVAQLNRGFSCLSATCCSTSLFSSSVTRGSQASHLPQLPLQLLQSLLNGSVATFD